MRATLPAFVLGALLLAGCGQSGADASDPAAGMDAEILKWRTEIEAEHVACKAKVEGKGCESFQVTCKALREISPDEKAKGVNSQIIAAMNFNGRNPDGSTGKPGSAFAEFTRTSQGWTRAAAEPVNLTTCAPY